MQRCDHAAILHGIASRRCICRIAACVALLQRVMQLCDRCSDAIMQRYCMASHRIAACIASLHASLYCSAAHIAASLHVSHRCMRRFIAALLVSQHRCMYRSVPIMQRCDAIHSAQQTAVCTVHNRHCQSVVHCAQQQLYTLCTVQQQLCTLVTATAGVHSTPRVQLTAVMHTVHNCPQLCTVCTVHNRDCQSVVHSSQQASSVC